MHAMILGLYAPRYALAVSIALTCFLVASSAWAEEESLKQGAKRAGRAAGDVVHDIG